MRDALRLLQEQGFAETIPYRGTYVTLLSLDNIKPDDLHACCG